MPEAWIAQLAPQTRLQRLSLQHQWRSTGVAAAGAFASRLQSLTVSDTAFPLCGHPRDADLSGLTGLTSLQAAGLMVREQRRCRQHGSTPCDCAVRPGPGGGGGGECVVHTCCTFSGGMGGARVRGAHMLHIFATPQRSSGRAYACLP
jgi:hypothetical protein